LHCQGLERKTHFLVVTICYYVMCVLTGVHCDFEVVNEIYMRFRLKDGCVKLWCQEFGGGDDVGREADGCGLWFELCEV